MHVKTNHSISSSRAQKSTSNANKSNPAECKILIATRISQTQERICDNKMHPEAFNNGFCTRDLALSFGQFMKERSCVFFHGIILLQNSLQQCCKCLPSIDGTHFFCLTNCCQGLVFLQCFQVYLCNGWCPLDPSKILSLLDYWDCPVMMTLDVVPVGMIVQIVKTVVIMIAKLLIPTKESMVRCYYTYT